MPTRPASLLLTGVLLTVSGALPAKDPDWLEGHSPHFHIISNAKPKQVAKVAQKLEEFRYLLASMFPNLRLDPPVPTTVVFFKNDKSARPYKPLTPKGEPRSLSGFFQASHEQMYLAVNVGESNAQEIAFHEYVHLVLNLNFQYVPLWLDEGLAIFYDGSQIDGVDVKLGYPHLDYWAVLQENKLIPLEVLLGVNHQSEYYYEPSKQSLFYGQSWVLVHYFMARDKGQRQKQFAEFVRLVQQAVPQQAAFTQAFGTDYQGMQRQLQDYLRRQTLGYFGVKLKSAAEKQVIELQPMETAVAQAHLADLWISQGRVAEAEEALRQLSLSATPPPEVLYRLGRIALQERRFAEAEERFQSALAARPDDIGLRYHAAWAVSLGRLQAATDRDERHAAAAQIIEYLSPVVTVESGFLDALDLLIHARLAHEDPPAEVIPVVEQARQWMPQRHDLGLMLASLYLNERRWDDAEKILNSVALGSPQADQRQSAERMLEQLRSMRQWQQTLHSTPESPRHTGEETAPGEEPARPRRTRLAEPVEPPPGPPTVISQKVDYVHGTLINVACSDDAAVVTVQASGEGEGSERVVHLAVRSRAKVILMDPTDSGQKLECGASGIPVGVNYRLQPEAPSVTGVVLSIEFFPLDRWR